MPHPPGHESGHLPRGLVLDAFTWRDYVDALRDELGGWTAIAQALQERAGSALVDDPESIIKGLKRLARNGQKQGGKYGALLLRVFGLPPSIRQWGCLMGQYHSRFADLPVNLRREQLTRWDRPPVSESPAAMWVHIGLASLAHRDRDLDEVRRRIQLASEVPRPEPASRIEYELLAARLASDLGDLAGEDDALSRAELVLGSAELSEDDRLCYTARLLDQRAYRASRGWRDAPHRLREALALYESIPDVQQPSFVAFRRALGLAWCRWRLGDAVEAARLARLANEHAGDGGLVRFRVMALQLLGNIEGGTEEGAQARARAVRLAELLQDADLTQRATRQAGLNLADSTP